MASKSNEKRPIIKLRSTEGSGYTYVTRKNRTNTRERVELKKYDPVLRRHVVFREGALTRASVIWVLTR